MFFRQILQDDLGCASYVLADAGEAVVVDPQWEIEVYLAAARAAGAEIRHVIETHNHADHVSGRLRLRAATGAELHVPADPDAAAGSPSLTQPGQTPLRAGDVVRIGELELHALAAPGHRPEHLALAVHDARGTGAVPAALLSGDSLLVGGVARPDLAVAPAEGAAALFDTLGRFSALGDAVELWPAHVGGSLCGSGEVQQATTSTIGAERSANPLMRITDRAEFVAEIATGSPTRPPRVAEVVALNIAGAQPPEPLAALDAEALAGQMAGGACLLDIRSPGEFDAGHLHGALNLAPGGAGLGNRAGWATRPGEPIVIVAPSEQEGTRFAERLYAAGVWSLDGVAAATPAAWSASRLIVEGAQAYTPEQVAAGLSDGYLALIDVRDPGEWRLGHVPGSIRMPLSELGDGRSVELPVNGRYAVACAGGARAALAASILRRAGYAQVQRMSGGVEELARLGSGFARGD
jgi:glyoxylase-like metal-dependent hydrolase (beta-lactamase superfamily II)/rhodanese-related sulfurtransferase